MKNNEQYKNAIQAVLDFKKIFDKIDTKVARKLVGELGELYVLDRLIQLGFKVEHLGGQSGHDIDVNLLDGKNIRVEVRTSLLKNEGIYNKTLNCWGWKVQGVSQKKEDKFDYLVCVALNDDFQNPSFYVFSQEEAFKLGDLEGIKWRFSNVKRKIHLFENKESFDKALSIESKQHLITEFEREINRNSELFKDRWFK